MNGVELGEQLQWSKKAIQTGCVQGRRRWPPGDTATALAVISGHHQHKTPVYLSNRKLFRGGQTHQSQVKGGIWRNPKEANEERAGRRQMKAPVSSSSLTGTYTNPSLHPMLTFNSFELWSMKLTLFFCSTIII